VNLGCGTQTPAGWVNVDYSVGARFAKLPLFSFVNRKLKLFNIDWNPDIVLHDLTKPFPWPDESVDVVYSSHTLEHMTREQGRAFLGECHRVLKRGGVLRIVVPDLAVLVSSYTSGAMTSDTFVENLGVLYEPSRNALKNRLAPFIQYPHRCMYDARTLKNIFEELGFDARPCKGFDSAIDDIREIELEDRTEQAVIIEGLRR
jgi:SAM-dependent methyltransferase